MNQTYEANQAALVAARSEGKVAVAMRPCDAGRVSEGIKSAAQSLFNAANVLEAAGYGHTGLCTQLRSEGKSLYALMRSQVVEFYL